jgi:hypothetical protein
MRAVSHSHLRTMRGRGSSFPAAEKAGATGPVAPDTRPEGPRPDRVHLVRAGPDDEVAQHAQSEESLDPGFGAAAGAAHAVPEPGVALLDCLANRECGHSCGLSVQLNQYEAVVVDQMGVRVAHTVVGRTAKPSRWWARRFVRDVSATFEAVPGALAAPRSGLPHT